MFEIIYVIGIIPKSYRSGYNIQGEPFEYLQHPHLEKFYENISLWVF